MTFLVDMKKLNLTQWIGFCFGKLEKKLIFLGCLKSHRKAIHGMTFHFSCCAWLPLQSHNVVSFTHRCLGDQPRFRRIPFCSQNSMGIPRLWQLLASRFLCCPHHGRLCTELVFGQPPPYYILSNGIIPSNGMGRQRSFNLGEHRSDSTCLIT